MTFNDEIVKNLIQFSRVNIFFNSYQNCTHQIGCPVKTEQVGDGNCDGEANIIECDFDGGDCCQMQHFGFANGFDCENGEDCKCYKSFNQTGIQIMIK